MLTIAEITTDKTIVLVFILSEMGEDMHDDAKSIYIVNPAVRDAQRLLTRRPTFLGAIH